MLWRWPRPRPPDKRDGQAGSRSDQEAVEETRGRGAEQEVRGADPANDEQRGNDDAVAAAGGRRGHDADAGHRSWQYRLCCGKTRDWCGRLVRHHYFEVGTMLLVFASSVTLIIQSPLDDPSETKAAVLKGIDLAMTLLFSCEMLLKVREREERATNRST